MFSDEKILIEQLAQGSRTAFDTLYLRYAAKTEEFVFRLLKNRTEAEDITHDLFLKLWRDRITLYHIDRFGSYLFKMARNAVYDRFDSRAVRESYAKSQSITTLTDYETQDVDNRDLLMLISLAIEKMPEQRRRIFRMSREEGLSNEQIAQQLGLNRRTVDNQISRALTELRRLLAAISVFF